MLNDEKVCSENEKPIALEPFGPSDFERLIGWIPSPSFLLQWAGPIFTFPLDAPQLEAYLHPAQEASPRRFIYRARETATGRIIGHVELNEVDRDTRRAKLCRVLIGEPSCRGRGLGHAMVRETVRIGFEAMDLGRIELAVFDFNRSALACYERLGFVITEHLPHARPFGIEEWGLYQMALERERWRES